VLDECPAHFALLCGLLDCPNEEVTGPAFGFSFLGFLFSRLLLCSRFAIGLSFARLFNW
jgi:hypothetical protein